MAGEVRPPQIFSTDELSELFRYFIAQFNHSLRMRLDLTNYRKGDDIDFIGAFEKYYTFDRLCASSMPSLSPLPWSIFLRYEMDRFNGGRTVFFARSPGQATLSTSSFAES